MVVELPPLGSPGTLGVASFPTQMLPTVQSFMQPVSGLSMASMGSQGPSAAPSAAQSLQAPPSALARTQSFQAASNSVSFCGLKPGLSFQASRTSFDGQGSALQDSRQSFAPIAGPPSPLAPMQAARVASPVQRQAQRPRRQSFGSEQPVASSVEARRPQQQSSGSERPSASSVEGPRLIPVDTQLAPQSQATYSATATPDEAVQLQPHPAASGPEDPHVLEARRSVEAAEQMQAQLELAHVQRGQAMQLQPPLVAASSPEDPQDPHVLDTRRSAEAAGQMHAQLERAQLQREQDAPSRLPTPRTARLPSVDSYDRFRGGSVKKRVVKYELKSLSASKNERSTGAPQELQ